MQVWLRAKLDGLIQEFLDGSGYGGVYEAQFLAYLECLVAHEYGVPRVTAFWDEWRTVCAAKTPQGGQVQCLSNLIQDREELVRALREFQRRFTGPTKRRFKAPVPPAPPVQGVDMIDFILGK